MTVRVRLQRFGRRNRPFYRVVVADSRAPRDGKFIELVGTYNPLATRSGVKEVTFKVDRIRYWISVGAQPSDRVAWLLGQFGILPPKVVPVARTKKILPRKERKELQKQQRGLHTSSAARLAALQPSCYAAADGGGPAGALSPAAVVAASVAGGVAGGHQVPPETRRQRSDAGVRFESPLSFGWATGEATAGIGGGGGGSSNSSSSHSAGASSTNPAQVDHGAVVGGSSLAARLSQMSLGGRRDDTGEQLARSNGGASDDEPPPLSTFSPLHAVLASHLALLGPAACATVGLRAGGAEGPMGKR